MRKLTSHQVNPANDEIAIAVLDEPGQGGACHIYEVDWPVGTTQIAFQDGPIKEAGVNGLTHEVLLAILEDRLEHFQAGPYACDENALALTKIREARFWLEHRTRGREVRGVEGTHEK